jgi:hypothetical protein
MRIPHLHYRLAHHLAGDALPAAVETCGYAANAADFNRPSIQRRIAQIYSGVADDIIVAIDVEHAAIGPCPYDILPRQSRDDLWRPDGFKKARSEPPALIAIRNLDAIVHWFDQPLQHWEVTVIRNMPDFPA